MATQVSFFRKVQTFVRGVRSVVTQDVLSRVGLSDPIGKLKRYHQHWGNGRAVTIYASSTDFSGLQIYLQKKVEAGDVAEGKLVPIVLQQMRKRSSKRVTGLRISIESARALHELLGEALRDVDASRKNVFLQSAMFDLYVRSFQSVTSSDN